MCTALDLTGVNDIGAHALGMYVPGIYLVSVSAVDRLMPRTHEFFR